jgi:hypothetical protein
MIPFFVRKLGSRQWPVMLAVDSRHALDRDGMFRTEVWVWIVERTNIEVRQIVTRWCNMDEEKVYPESWENVRHNEADKENFKILTEALPPCFRSNQ